MRFKFKHAFGIDVVCRCVKGWLTSLTKIYSTEFILESSFLKINRTHKKNGKEKWAYDNAGKNKLSFFPGMVVA